MSRPGGQTISTSMESRLELPRWSIRAVPPLKTKGQPAIFRDSSKEKVRMDFSRSDASLMLGYWERSDSIHWAERLSGLISVRLVYIVESFLDLVDTPAAAGISLESGN